MENLIAYSNLLMQGTIVTVSVGIASLIVAVILGLLGAWAKSVQPPDGIRWPLTAEMNRLDAAD